MGTAELGFGLKVGEEAFGEEAFGEGAFGQSIRIVSLQLRAPVSCTADAQGSGLPCHVIPIA